MIETLSRNLFDVGNHFLPKNGLPISIFDNSQQIEI